MIRGRRETYANLFLGVFVCLLFFLLCKMLGEMMSHNGFGWWLGNLVTLIAGLILLLKSEKNNNSSAVDREKHQIINFLVLNNKARLI